MMELQDWSLESGLLVKEFNFPNFEAALEFVNKVGEIAKKHNHHPDIILRYNQVRLNLVTYEENSLTKRDFEVAKEIDGLGS